MCRAKLPSIPPITLSGVPLRAIACIDESGAATYRPLSSPDTPSSPNELIINKGRLCRTPVNGRRDGSDRLDGNRCGVEPHPPHPPPPRVDHACTGAPASLIKHPQVALVFQLGCSLSPQYWHVFNNSWRCGPEGGAQGSLQTLW